MVISKEEKLRLNREYLDRKHLKASEGYRSRNSFVNSLRSWVRKYQNDGKAGLVRAKKSAAIPESDKLSVVERILAGERKN